MKTVLFNLLIVFLASIFTVYAERLDESQMADGDNSKRTFDHEFLGGNLRFKRPTFKRSSSDQYFNELDAAYKRLRKHLEKKSV